MPRVVVDIGPVHALVAQVMKGLGTPELIVRPDASPHTYAMRPSEAAALAEASLTVWIGPELTPWLGEAIGTLSRGQSLALLTVPGTTLRPYRGAHEPHDQDATDPHAWLDPENGKLWLEAIAEALAGLDPGNAGRYRQNAAAGMARIDAAAAEVEALLAERRDLPLVVYHDAYGYFTGRFGLPEATALATGETAPPPSRVAEVAAELRRSDAGCIFAQPQFSPSLVRTVTEGTGARLAILDPLGAELQPGPSLYSALLVGMARTLAGCAASR